MNVDYDGQKLLIKDLEMLERACQSDTQLFLHVSRITDLARGGFYHISDKREPVTRKYIAVQGYMKGKGTIVRPHLRHNGALKLNGNDSTKDDDNVL